MKKFPRAEGFLRRFSTIVVDFGRKNRANVA